MRGKGRQGGRRLRNVRLSLPLVLVLCACVVRGASGQEECQWGAAEEWRQDEPTEWRRYIVRFHEYAYQEEHRARLSFLLHVDASAHRAVEGRWRWVWRDNAATRYKTDFGVVEIRPSQAGAEYAHDDVGDGAGRRRQPRRASSSSSMDTTSLEIAIRKSPELRRMVRGVHLDASLTAGTRRLLYEDQMESMASKPPGRRRTRTSFEVHQEHLIRGIAEGDWDAVGLGIDQATVGSREGTGSTRRRSPQLFGSGPGVADAMSAPKLWSQKLSGADVRVGIFDTGVDDKHPYLKNVKERSNFTKEPTLSDSLGHGSFVAGVIGSTNPSCLGFAPDVEIYTFRVFTNDQVSYTSWFMDAFNYAIVTKMDVINISIGGPDFQDLPFAEKTLEVIANGIVVFAANGNDGPKWGTVNHPAEEPSVIAVGGIDYSNKLAAFSSRGMSLKEIAATPSGYGRPKPDLVAYGSNVLGIQPQASGCRPLSGTSVASPVATGAAALLISSVPRAERAMKVNPASVKQVLQGTATRIQGSSIFEQGAGQIDMEKALERLKRYTPHASLFPASIDLTDCPYMGPFCDQPLYAGSMAVVYNSTIINGMGAHGKLVGQPTFTENSWVGGHLDVSFEYSEYLWPFTGWLAVFIRVKASSREYSGAASGTIQFTVESPPGPGETDARRSAVSVPLAVNIVPVPPRNQRILWDHFHSLPYPPVISPRDNLDDTPDTLDWHGDHPHTNFREMLAGLRRQGYFLEVLGSPFTCFDAASYGHLLIVDPEDEFHPDEISKLKNDVEEKGLNVIVFSDWYNVDMMRRMRFFDDNTLSWWTMPVGGSNVPALNDLLRPFGAELGAVVFDAEFTGAGGTVALKSACNLRRWPTGGHVFPAAKIDLKQDDGTTRADGKLYLGGVASAGNGTLSVFGDSTCLDSSQSERTRCVHVLLGMLQRAKDRSEFWMSRGARAVEEGGSELAQGPSAERRDDAEFTSMSRTVGRELRCDPTCSCMHQGLDALDRMDDPFTSVEADRRVDNDSERDEFYKDIIVFKKMISSDVVEKISSASHGDFCSTNPDGGAHVASSMLPSTSSSKPHGGFAREIVSATGTTSVYARNLAATNSIASILSMCTLIVVVWILYIMCRKQRRDPMRLPRSSSQTLPGNR